MRKRYSKSSRREQFVKLLALADDSGLCVNALEGEPGIFSARWADSQGGFRGAMQRIQSELSASPDRSAFFICVLALAWPSGRVETVEGRIEGTISLTPRGDHGHGYDPIFVPKGRTHTFAEMTESDKNAISHRGLAFDALKAKFL